MSNVLRNLPSISELLESPPLRSLVRRVNRNAVVTGVKQFLDKMRIQVQSAAARLLLPSLSISDRTQTLGVRRPHRNFAWEREMIHSNAKPSGLPIACLTRVQVVSRRIR